MQISDEYMQWAQECMQRYEANKDVWDAECLKRAAGVGWSSGWLKVIRDADAVTVCRIVFPVEAAPTEYMIQWFEPYYHFRPWTRFLKREWEEISTGRLKVHWEVYATCDNIPLLLTMASRFGGEITFWNDAYYRRPPMPIPAHEPPTGDQIGAD